MSGAPVDLDHLDRYVAGDPGLRAEVLALFLEQAEGWPTALAPTLEDGAWADLCHSIKGGARGVGAFALGDLAEKGEAMTGPGMTEKRRALAAAVAYEVGRAAGYLRAALPDAA